MPSSHDTIAAVDTWLPQTQCTRCGYPRCRAYAEAIVLGEADIDQCPPGGEVTIAAVAQLLGVPVKPLNPRFGGQTQRVRAVIDEAHCIGCRKCIDACPVDAIVGAAKLMHTVIARDCTGCALCVAPCPVDCIALLPVENDGAPWRSYGQAEAAHWRALSERNLKRCGQSKSRTQSPTSNPARAHIRAEIKAAVARVHAKRSGRGR